MHRFPRIISWLTLCSFLAAGAFMAAWSQPASADSGELLRLDLARPVDIRADELVYDQDSNSYLATGEVELSQGGNRLLADKVRLFADTLITEASGAVRFVSPDQILTGDEMVMDLNRATGKLYNATVYVRQNNYYLRGAEIEKTGKETYWMSQGRFTSCDGADPAWEVAGSEVEVTLEGYGTADNSTFRVRDFPILWSPYMVFPVKFKRQSGLLTPLLGTSDRDGFLISQPYFQTLGDNQDLTGTLTYMARRGVDVGVEYRYNLSETSKGMFLADYMPNDLAGQDLYNSGENAKPYEKRWWIRGKAEQSLFDDTMSLKVDLDLVSDQDYLKEFRWGYNGFDATDSRILEWFGENLDPYTSYLRRNQINLQRDWAQSSFNATIQYYDNLLTDNKTTLQKLPQLSYDAISQEIGETGLYFQMDSSYVYYYRETWTTGSIVDINPNFSLPMNFNDYLELEPSFTWSERLYWLDLDGEPKTRDDNGTSEQWYFSTQASSYVYRVFDLGTAGNPYKIKHAVRPEVTYSYRPSFSETHVSSLAARNLPQINTINYGIRNTLTSKEMLTNLATGEVTPYYNEFLRFNIFHTLDLDAFKGDGDEDDNTNGYLTSRLEYQPSTYLYFSNDLSYDLDLENWDLVYTRLSAVDDRGDFIALDHVYSDDGINQVILDIRLALNQQWALGYKASKDIENEEDLENIYQIEYMSQCWGVRAFYTEDYLDRGFFIAFSLNGFGELIGFSPSLPGGSE